MESTGWGRSCSLQSATPRSDGSSPWPPGNGSQLTTLQLTQWHQQKCNRLKSQSRRYHLTSGSWFLKILIYVCCPATSPLRSSSSSTPLSCGVPQGSIWSPLLFTIYMIPLKKINFENNYWGKKKKGTMLLSLISKLNFGHFVLYFFAMLSVFLIYLLHTLLFLAESYVLIYLYKVMVPFLCLWQIRPKQQQ